MALGDVIDVGCGTDDGVNQARVGIDTNVRLHAEVPLVALFGLVHLGIAFGFWSRARRAHSAAPARQVQVP